jgi:hypothetical protein
MAKVTAEEYAEKWGRRLSGATADITRGIDRTTEAPGLKAAKAQDKMLSKVTEAVSSGRWAKKVGAVSLEDWKNAAKNKGVGRISQGVQSALPSQAAMAAKLLAAVDAAVAAVKVMPSTTLEDNIARSATYMREMAKRKGL